jgi:hypothetical protein
VPFETLVALFAGELDERAVDAAEAHVFACDACAASHARLAELVMATRDLVPPVISAAHRDRLLAAGKNLVVTQVTPETVPTARFAPGVDLLIHALQGDLTGAERVDVELVGPGFVLEHVPFDPVAGEVLIACQRHYQAFGDTRFRVHAYRGGRRETVSEYYVDHLWD